MDRREFLKWSGVGLAGVPALGAGREVSLEVAKDPVAQSAAVQWAIAELRKAVTVRDSAPFKVSLSAAHITAGAKAESYSFVPAANRLDVRAYDPRGMVYAITELAQRAPQERFGIAA